MKRENIKLIIFTLSIIVICIGTFLILFSIGFDPFKTEPLYTSTYERINVSVAKDLINSDQNLSVIDCTGGCQSCQWKNGKLPRAEWVVNSEYFYNTTKDLLIYSYDGTRSLTFCEQLVNHTYGKIYHLDDGLLAWNE